MSVKDWCNDARAKSNDCHHFVKIAIFSHNSAATDFKQNYQNRLPHYSFFPYTSGFFRLARFTAQKQNC
jgi:hypothetical protein